MSALEDKANAVFYLEWIRDETKESLEYYQAELKRSYTTPSDKAKYKVDIATKKARVKELNSAIRFVKKVKI